MNIGPLSRYAKAAAQSGTTIICRKALLTSILDQNPLLCPELLPTSYNRHDNLRHVSREPTLRDFLSVRVCNHSPTSGLQIRSLFPRAPCLPYSRPAPLNIVSPSSSSPQLVFIRNSVIYFSRVTGNTIDLANAMSAATLVSTSAPYFAK